jgi:glycosyltransferase involved in cell wall biosynthesis
MLSILIPVYNQNVCPLVNNLNKQAKELGIDHEIILIDDASDEACRKVNRCLSRMGGVTYIELAENEGRAAVRNMLAEAARHPYLLFMDGDAEVDHPDFLRTYLDYCLGEVVVCGGTGYHVQRPEQASQRLRWKYGIRKEMIPASKRSRYPYSSFSAFNFIASAAVMKKIHFEETLARYGHEDTLFGYCLAKEKIQVRHIDNPLIHAGLDTNIVFLAKTREAAKSLAQLFHRYRLDLEFSRSVTLLRYYRFLVNTGLIKSLLWLYKRFSKQIESNLLSRHPSLLLLQWFKLFYFHHSFKEAQENAE